MTVEHTQETRPAYRTLNEPARLLGLSAAGWVAVLVAGGAGYGWLLISPLPWRANVSLAAILLGLPTALVLLGEQSTITPARLLTSVLRWRVRPPLVHGVDDAQPVRRGGVRLDCSAPADALSVPDAPVELPWVDDDREAH